MKEVNAEERDYLIVNTTLAIVLTNTTQDE